MSEKDDIEREIALYGLPHVIKDMRDNIVALKVLSSLLMFALLTVAFKAFGVIM